MKRKFSVHCFLSIMAALILMIASFAQVYAAETAAKNTASQIRQVDIPLEGNCDGSAWEKEKIYLGTNAVLHNGHTWEAKWWTRGDEPGTTGQYGVWKDLGECDGPGNDDTEIKIVSPGDGDIIPFGNSVTIRSDVSSTYVIANIEFKNGSQTIGNDRNEPYEHVWENPPEGNYTLTLIATFTNGSQVISKPVNVSVEKNEGECTDPAWEAESIYVSKDKVSHNGHTWNAKWWTRGDEPGTTGPYGVWEDLGVCEPGTIPPEVNITEPANGKNYPSGSSITIKTDVTTNGTAISGVSFYANTNKIGEDNDSPFVITWDAQDGESLLKAVILTVEGESIESDPVKICVGDCGGTDDSIPPVKPSKPEGAAVDSSSVKLTWNESTDNVGVTGYNVYVDDLLTKTETVTASTVNGLEAETYYNFYITAIDAAGNESEKSDLVRVQTKKPDGPFSSGDLKITYTKESETDSTFEGLLVIENPNSTYAWNATDFAIWSIDLITTSEITEIKNVEGGSIEQSSITVSDSKVSIDLGWQSHGFYPGTEPIRFIVKGNKKGDHPELTDFKPDYVRGVDIVYPEYADLPASWSKNKADLSISDLIENETDYYKVEAEPITDLFIMYNPSHKTQVNIGQVMSIDYPVNSTNNVRVRIMTPYTALGIGYVYEMFKINPHYMVALGTKENYSSGIVPPEAGTNINPVEVDGEQWYWPIVAPHNHGPYQQEEPNFSDCQKLFPDMLHDTDPHDLVRIGDDLFNDVNWITSGISSGLSLTVSRESIYAIKNANMREFCETANDPYAEFSMLTFSYNRGFSSFNTKKLLGLNRSEALASDDIARDFELAGHASHVETVRAIVDQMNKTTDDIYDARLSWQDMETYFAQLRRFYKAGIPNDSEWKNMLEDVHRAYNLLANHWEDGKCSFRYDFLTLFRVGEKYLPTPRLARPTGQHWYYLIKNTILEQD